LSVRISHAFAEMCDGSTDLNRPDDASLQPSRDETTGGPVGTLAHTAEPERQVVAVLVSLLVPGESPRLEGQDQAHVARLAEIDGPLPPILVDRTTMQVIDGTHRLMATILKGRRTIDVEFFDGNPADAFLRAVEANVTHGFPLSQADRRAAATRIIRSHPHMSDRAIAQVAGLAAKTVAGIRRHCEETVSMLDARVGRDGRVRPLNSVEGRRRVAELMSEHPQASLREVARGAGVSPATASDVRKRLQRGEEPIPEPVGPRPRPRLAVVPPDPATVLEKLLRDPSLRHNEDGRRLLRLLRLSAIGAQELSDLIAAMPPHCTALVRQLAQQYAQMWSEFARDLDERSRSTTCMAVGE
jgi:ParB-like chromosome segregation protein Spo0J